MTEFQTGLMVSVVGLAITFVALGVFIGVIVILQKLFPAKPEEEQEATELVAAIAEVDEDENAAVAAAIAAISYLRS
jgi:sodium pump decarboxylase gamma subunit